MVTFCESVWIKLGVWKREIIFSLCVLEKHFVWLLSKIEFIVHVPSNGEGEENSAKLEGNSLEKWASRFNFILLEEKLSHSGIVAGFCKEFLRKLRRESNLRNHSNIKYRKIFDWWPPYYKICAVFLRQKRKILNRLQVLRNFWSTPNPHWKH